MTNLQKIKLPEGWEHGWTWLLSDRIPVVKHKDTELRVDSTGEILLPYSGGCDSVCECESTSLSEEEQVPFLLAYQEAMEIARQIREMWEGK